MDKQRLQYLAGIKVITETYHEEEMEHKQDAGGPISSMSNEDLAAYIGTSVPEVESDRDAAEAAAHEKTVDYGQEQQEYEQAGSEEMEYEEEEVAGFRKSLHVVASELVRGVNLLGIQRKEVTVADVADSLLDGRWREMLKDQIVDLLNDSMRKSGYLSSHNPDKS